MRKNKRLFGWFLILGLMIFLGLVGFMTPSSKVVAFQPTPSDDEVNEIASELFCPVCENVPLDVCDTEACRQWRSLIRQMLAEGKTKEEITVYFSETYGIRVLSEPPLTGFNWLVYIVPPVAFFLGTFFLFKAFRTWKKKGDDKSVFTDDSEKQEMMNDGEYKKRFEKEFEKRK
jgi:cytochrome c-type biogenesis protein CcmH